MREERWSGVYRKGKHENVTRGGIINVLIMHKTMHIYYIYGGPSLYLIQWEVLENKYTHPTPTKH